MWANFLPSLILKFVVSKQKIVMNTTTLYSINSSDMLSGRLTSRGSNVYNFEISGVETLREVYSFLISQVDGISGVLKLQLRNRSQGWTNDYNLRFS